MAIMHERIKELRSQKGFTLSQVAEFLGVTEATAQRYETGKGIKTIPYEVIEKYAEMFHCNPAYLMGWDNNEEETSKKIDATTDILIRMERDMDFSEVVQLLYKLDSEKLAAVKIMLNSFSQ